MWHAPWQGVVHVFAAVFSLSDKSKPIASEVSRSFFAYADAVVLRRAGVVHGIHQLDGVGIGFQAACYGAVFETKRGEVFFVGARVAESWFSPVDKSTPSNAGAVFCRPTNWA